jgi:flagellar motor switch protein FliN/FliY
MADEELLEEGEEKQDPEVENQEPEESAEEASSENDSAAEGEDAAELNAESEADVSEDAPEEAEASESEESPDESAEQSVDELAEQQMLAELERLETEGQASDGDSQEDTIMDVQQPDFPTFNKSATAAQEKNLDLLLDVNLPISIELGRTTMRIKDILALGPGSVVELKKLAGEPVDLLVNNKIVAKGEVVVVDENFGLRIVSLLSREERLRSLEE